MDYRHGLDFKRAWFWPSLVASAACVCLLSQARQASDVWAVCSKARNIYTVDDQRPRVNCVAVRGTMILGAGDYGASTCWVMHERCGVLNSNI